MIMNDDFFKADGIAPIFEARAYEGAYFAGYDSCFTELGPRERVDIDYRSRFDAGRYVIYVYERHSLYQDGKRYYADPNFSGEIARDNRGRRAAYVIMTDEKHGYKVPSWHDMTLDSYLVRDEESPLQLKTFSTLAEAQEHASGYSRSGRRSAVLLICGEWDMY